MGAPFDPKEVIFAPTAACNLACGHCRVDRTRGTGDRRLTAEKAVAFLRDCADQGIERVGFSGGEPFLEPGFLRAIIAEAVDLGLYFDRLMTNGTWYRDETRLREVLNSVFDAGFDGTVGLSLDGWHAQDPGRIALFIHAVSEISLRSDAVEIDAALDPQGAYPTALFEAVVQGLNDLATARTAMGADMEPRFLNLRLISEDGIPLAIEDALYRQNVEAGMNDGTGLRIPITGIPYSRGSDDPEAWKADAWFEDDWCEGPGNVLYVHADGVVAACCGFANERPELALGTVDDGAQAVIQAGITLPYPRKCYQTGLGAYRQELEAQGATFPGKTADMCFFCDWICSKGLARKGEI